MILFALGFAFTLILALALVLVLHKVGLLRNHGDVTNRFEAHRELVNGTLDLMRERMNTKLETMETVFEAKAKAELESMKKDLEDARAGVLNIAHRLDALQDKYEQLVTTAGLPGESQSVPRDMEVVGGGAIGND